MVKISVTGRVLQQKQSYTVTLMRRIMWSRLKKSEALHYGKGMKDAAVSVIKVENRDLQGIKIPGIQNYHSVQFQEKKMMFWRYYGVGNGVSHPYNNLKVGSGATIIKPFSRTDKRIYESSNQAALNNQHQRRLRGMIESSVTFLLHGTWLFIFF